LVLVAHELDQPTWQAREAAHAQLVDELTADHRRRRRGHLPHPVEDFLFTYYQHRPAQLRRWHPGAGVDLLGDAAAQRARWPCYAYDGRAARLDTRVFLAARGETVRFVRDLLTATAARPANLGCFGLHEWAMAYRQEPHELRHPSWPLRLGRDGTDAVVESHRLRCSHADAFRFFTEAARPLNEGEPRRETQTATEQPGCLHATMDLYKWAFKLSPAIPSALTADCFELAREVRVMDMRAAPYDLRELGYQPVRIETATGKAEYAAAQSDFAARGAVLRARIIAVCDALLS